MSSRSDLSGSLGEFEGLGAGSMDTVVLNSIETNGCGCRIGAPSWGAAAVEVGFVAPFLIRLRRRRRVATHERPGPGSPSETSGGHTSSARASSESTRSRQLGTRS